MALSLNLGKSLNQEEVSRVIDHLIESIRNNQRYENVRKDKIEPQKNDSGKIIGYEAHILFSELGKLKRQIMYLRPGNFFLVGKIIPENPNLE